MKKIIFTLICILMLPIIVHADYSLPMAYNYNVSITNQNGASVYSLDGEMQSRIYTLTSEKIAYDTKVKVVNENYHKGNYYLEISTTEIYDYDNRKFILAEDAKVTDEKVDLESQNADQNIYKETYYTLFDTKMYKGPSAKYGEIENIVIPAGTTITYDYLMDDGDNGIPMWIRVKYNDVTGWVYCYNWFANTEDKVNNIPVTVVQELDAKSELYLYQALDVYSYNGIMEQSQKVGTFPVGAKVKFLYSMRSGVKETSYYAEYNGLKGWVKTYSGYCPFCGDAYATYQPGEYFAFEEVELYNNYIDQTPVGTMPMLTILNGYYDFCLSTDTAEYEATGIVERCYAIVEYQGKNYYVKNNETSLDDAGDIQTTESKIAPINITYETTKSYKIKTKQDVILYSSPFYSQPTRFQESYAFNKEFETSLVAYVQTGIFGKEAWYYVSYPNDIGGTTFGWLKLTEDNAEITELDAVETETTNDKNKGLKPIQIGLLCGAGALLITVISAVVIIKVNKKKKNNKKETEEPKEKNK